ncbi:Endoplasmic reticulum metallopeptidase 1 [Thoreauomyces humboldtii]|nr:Endoplasmic reticulum metallopeptidase 1 [Thoreauomyces humboldtii]
MFGLARRVAAHIYKIASRVATHPYAARTVQSISICVFMVAFSCLIRWGASTAALPRHVRHKNTTAAFSGGEAWRHLGDLVAVGPRMYNSEANLAARGIIVGKMGALAQAAQTLGKPLDWLTVSPNDESNVIIGDTYFESSNVAVRLRGAETDSTRHAFLVSAHYDSTPVSPGVTDDGIAVASMIELVRALAYAPQLKNDLILVFTNGEEVGLFGGYSFVHHPWFGDVRGFMNLDGAGAAGRSRSLLFRTNSQELVTMFASAAPYPHASVLVDDLMAIVHSDTDFRPFVTNGNLPGIDIAFYTQRYLYHSTKDDLAHADPISAQQLGDNVLALVQAVCGSSRLATLKPTVLAQTPMHNGNFVYYDVLGRRMVVTTAAVYKTGMSLLVIAVALGTVFKGFAETRKYGFKRAAKRYALPIAEVYLLVLVTAVLSVLVVVVLSILKSHFNPGSTYGNPRANLGWIAGATMATAAGVQAVWPWIALKLRLRKAPLVVYSLLPTADRFEEHDDEATGLLARDEEDNEAGFGLLHAERDDHAGGDRGPEQRSRSRKAVVPAGPSLHTWLPYGQLGFWWTMLFVALGWADRRTMGAYVLYNFAFFSALAVVSTSISGTFARRWWRRDINEENSVDDEQPHQSTLAVWKQRAVALFDQYAWVVAMGIGAVAPSLNALDIIDLVLHAVPALIAEALPETLVDLLFAAPVLLMALTLVPALSRPRIHRKAFAAFAVVCVFAPPYLYSLTRFPFKPATPQKLAYAEVYDVSDGARARTARATVMVAPTMKAQRWGKQATRKEEAWFDCEEAALPHINGKCVFKDAEPPVVHNPALALDGMPLTWDQFIHVNVSENPSGHVRAVWEGPPGSRVCTVHLIASEVDDDAEASETTPDLSVRIDDRSTPWIPVDADILAPTSDALHVSATLFARGYNEPVEAKRIRGSAKATYNPLHFPNGSTPILRVSCYLSEILTSNTYRLLTLGAENMSVQVTGPARTSPPVEPWMVFSHALSGLGNEVGLESFGSTASRAGGVAVMKDTEGWKGSFRMS